jgi:hypothetical protein
MLDTEFISWNLIGPADVRSFSGGRSEIVYFGDELRIPDEFLKAVAFIGEMAGEHQGDLLATGFFVSIPTRLPKRILFFVTAKHIATDLKDRTAYITVNKKGGGVTTLNQIGSHWWLHPTDKTADVALVECNVRPDQDVRGIPIERFITPDMLKENEGIGAGDETFAIGLFTPAPGVSENLPIVRHGNIAMLPKEQIQTELGFADVFLVEARSIGGLSGSPVFVRETIVVPFQKQPDEIEQSFLSGLGKFYFLGVMQGHWDIKESDINKAAVHHDSKRGVNMGVGIVVPAMKILETIRQRELMKQIEELENRELKKQSNIPGLDSARAKRDEPGFSKSDFETALKKVSRKIEPSK